MVAYIISEGAGTAADTVPAKKSETKGLPVTICQSRNATPEASPYSGIYNIKARVIVRTQGSGEDIENQSDTPAQESGDRVANVFDLFHLDGDQAGETLAIAISDAAQDAGIEDFSVINAKVTEIDAGFEGIGEAWSDMLFLELVCTTANITNPT